MFTISKNAIDFVANPILNSINKMKNVGMERIPTTNIGRATPLTIFAITIRLAEIGK